MSLRTLLLFLALSLLSSACLTPSGSDDDDDDDDSVETSSVVLSEGPPAELPAGESVQLTARAFDSTGEVEDAELDWSVADTDVAVVDDDGVLTGVALGETTVTVGFEGAEDTAAFTVTDPCPITETLTWQNDVISRSVSIEAGPCISSTGAYRTNLRLDLSEDRSVQFQLETFSGTFTPAVRVYPFAGGASVFELTQAFTASSVTLDAGSYRVEVSTNEAGAQGLVGLDLTDRCVGPQHIGLGSFGTQSESFSLGDGDCLSDDRYRLDFAFNAGPNSVPYSLNLQIAFDAQVDAGLMVDAGTAGSSTSNQNGVTSMSWSDSVYGGTGVSGWLKADRPVTGTITLTRTSQ